VCVEVKHAAAGRDFDRGFVLSVREPIIAIPNNGPLAGLLFDNDEGYLSFLTFDRLREVEIHAFVFKRQQTEAPGFI